VSGLFQFFFDASEMIGTVAFAASGAMLAIDRELDLFGVVFLGITTAVGGGIMRDIVLGAFPPNAFSNSIYVLVALVTSLIVFVYAWMRSAKYRERRKAIDRVIDLLDALGLGIFSVIGAQTAINAGYIDNAFLCIFTAMSTGVGGGILRDLLSRTMPAVMHERIYALASIAGGAGYYFLVRTGLAGPAAMLIGMAVTIVIRLMAMSFRWHLPKVSNS